MSRKTFISYKYSDARELRDKIIKKMGEDGIYYQGERSDSPDLTDTTTENIKKNLTDMMYNTSVTIVILSPNMKESKWIAWEIEYCLKNISRKNRTSQTNGVVGVIMKIDGAYDWLISKGKNCHGTSTISYDMDKICPIIKKNKFNSEPKEWHCSSCKTYDYNNGGYITFVKEDDFLNNIEDYIEKAFKKSENNASGYNLVKS